jgi:CheY-like chemotaxis protein
MKRRILLIEDDPFSQDLIKSILEHRGHEVDVAAEGFAGLELLRQKNYDLALVDYHLPEMDGFALARLIKEVTKRRGGLPKVVGLTADQHGLASRRGADAMFEAIVAKPIAAEALHELVERCCPPAESLSSTIASTIDNFRRNPHPDSGRMFASAFWNRLGLSALPKICVLPDPTFEQRDTLALCFDVCQPAEAQILALLDRVEPIEVMSFLDVASRSEILPIICLSDALADFSDAVFIPNDRDSWSKVAALVQRSLRLQREVGGGAKAEDIGASVEREDLESAKELGAAS